ncbi:MAG: hypothetical protein CSB21_02715 [Deltaproteobacteria bacterium]|nr:MAG: hypothetical protein CSB21_02715 [Deltaproteobacteria bacterium]
MDDSLNQKMIDAVNQESFSKEHIEKRKKAIFDAMGKRAQRAIIRKGYERWNPFQGPNDPIEIRVDKTGNTVSSLVDKFFDTYPDKKENNAYRKVVENMALGVVTDDDRVNASYLFSMWYKDLLEKAGIKNGLL